MAVARRHTDYDVAGVDQGQMRRHRRSGQPIEYRDIVGFRRASEMIERQRLEPLEAQCRRDFIVGKCELFGGERQRMLEPGEDVNLIRAQPADQRPCALQFLKIVLGAGEDLAARIRQVRRMQIAEAIDAHPGSPSSVSAARRPAETCHDR
jgi:hypothetical protein